MCFKTSDELLQRINLDVVNDNDKKIFKDIVSDKIKKIDVYSDNMIKNKKTIFYEVANFIDEDTYVFSCQYLIDLLKSNDLGEKKKEILKILFASIKSYQQILKGVYSNKIPISEIVEGEKLVKVEFQMTDNLIKINEMFKKIMKNLDYSECLTVIEALFFLVTKLNSLEYYEFLQKLYKNEKEIIQKVYDDLNYVPHSKVKKYKKANNY